MEARWLSHLSLVLAIFVALVHISDSTTGQSKLPNAQLLGSGYNVFLADPFAKYQDPGFSTSARLFNLSYSGTNTVNSWILPDGYIPSQPDECEVVSQSKLVETAEEYKSMLSIKVSTGVSLPEASFSASVGFREVSSTIKKDSSVFAVATGYCNVVSVSLDKFEAPSLSSDIITALAHLPPTVNVTDAQDPWFNLLDIFGTHVLLGLDFGSSYVYRLQMSMSSLARMHKESIDVSVEVSVMALYHFGMSVKHSDQSKISTMTKDSKTYLSSVGVPPSSNNTGAWASASVDSNRMGVVRITNMVPIYKLFEYPLLAHNVTDSTLYANNLKVAYSHYCNNHLKPTGKVTSCVAAPTPRTIRCPIYKQFWLVYWNNNGDPQPLFQLPPLPNWQTSWRGMRVNLWGSGIGPMIKPGGTFIVHQWVARLTFCTNITQGGNYTFATYSGAGSRLFVNKTLVVDNDGDHQPKQADGSIKLFKGEIVELVLDYFNTWGRKPVLKLLYKGPETNQKMVDFPDEKMVLCEPDQYKVIHRVCGNETFTFGL